MVKINSDLNPISITKESSKIADDAVALVIKRILNNKKIYFKDCHLLVEISKENKSVFSNKEIELIVNAVPLFKLLVEQETAMIIFKEISGKERWTVSHISKEINIPRKTIYSWMTKLTEFDLVKISEKQNRVGNVKFYSLNWKDYKYIILALRQYFMEILASRK